MERGTCGTVGDLLAHGVGDDRESGAGVDLRRVLRQQNGGKVEPGGFVVLLAAVGSVQLVVHLSLFTVSSFRRVRSGLVGFCRFLLGFTGFL